VCKCPKDRTLREYWHFCQRHAAEYNKNWNFYAGMTADEIEREWDRKTFGDSSAAAGFGADYARAIEGFLKGRAKMPALKIPADVSAAFATFGLPAGAKWAEIQKKYRELAKLEHPDTSKSKDQSRFVKIGDAYQTLKKHFGKLGK
jgi:DnaJ-domain-containing protein 1